MRKVASILARGVALATLLLACAGPALGQDTDPGVIWAWSPGPGTSQTADFYVVNNTRSPISITSAGWTLPHPFSKPVPSWQVGASMGVDLTHKANQGSLRFDIGGSSSGPGSVYITNMTEDHRDDVWWELSGADSSWQRTQLPPQQDPVSGACAFTGDWATAMYNSKYAVTLMNASWDDAGKYSKNWKMVLVFSEFPVDGSGKVIQIFQNCQEIFGEQWEYGRSRRTAAAQRATGRAK